MSTKERRCGCPEQYKGRWCAACHGTGYIPPRSHSPIQVLTWSKDIECDGKHAEPGAQDRAGEGEK